MRIVVTYVQDAPFTSKLQELHLDIIACRAVHFFEAFRGQWLTTCILSAFSDCCLYVNQNVTQKVVKKYIRLGTS